MTYIKVTPQTIAFGGAPSLNLSRILSTDASALSSGSASFQPFAVLSDTTSVSPFSATTTNCTDAGDECFSFVFPGNVVDLYVGTDPNSTQTHRLVEDNDTPADATTYVLENATAYQLEYYPLQQNVEFNFSTDCTMILRWSYVLNPFQLCVKEIDDDIAACNLFHYFHLNCSLHFLR